MEWGKKLLASVIGSELYEKTVKNFLQIILRASLFHTFLPLPISYTLYQSGVGHL